MINDGGLRSLLNTADLVSSELFLLNKPRQTATSKRQRRKQFQSAEEHNEPCQSKYSKHPKAEEHGDRSACAAVAGTRRKPSRSLSELSNSQPEPLKKMNLAKFTSAELKQVISPLLKKLEELDAAALLSLNPTENDNGATLDAEKGLTVPPIHDRISPTYDGVDCDGNDLDIVRYLHVQEVPKKYSVGIFVFPPDTQIPLHDHPNMVVLSRVLYGHLKVQSFDLIPRKPLGDKSSSHSEEGESPATKNEETSEEGAQSPPDSKPSAFRSPLNILKDFVTQAINPFHAEEEDLDAETDCESSSSTEPRHLVDCVLRAKENLRPMGVKMPSPNDHEEDASATISAPKVTCLYPHEGNCHSFVAGPHGAAVLDILLPPYDSDEDRDCTFYEASENSGTSIFHDHHFDSPPQERNVNGKRARSYELTPIEQPDTFHCLSGVYGRFGACKNYCDIDADFSDEEDQQISESSTL